MKLIDKALRYWRVEIGLREAPDNIRAVFDIGCDDGYLLKKFADNDIRRDGCDPRLTMGSVGPNFRVLKGFFPSVIEDIHSDGCYDAVFAFAVFEHFTEADLRTSASVIAKMLSANGRLIITVPHPFVDKILDLLSLLRLIDGQALEEHHGFDPESLINYFSETLKLTKRKTFQFGLNNIFVFEKIS